jgi:P63C domain
MFGSSRQNSTSRFTLLYGWNYYENCGRPAVLGHITNNVIYKRLAPGVLDELRKMVLRDEKGRLETKLVRGLTPNYRPPKLSEQLTGTTMIAKYSPNLQVFNQRLDREYPQYGKTLPLPFPEKLKELARESEHS